jgi:hypothetical protein
VIRYKDYANVEDKATEIIQVNAEENAGIYMKNLKKQALNNVQLNNKHEITHQNIKITLHADFLYTLEHTLSIQTTPHMPHCRI